MWKLYEINNNLAFCALVIRIDWLRQSQISSDIRNYCNIRLIKNFVDLTSLLATSTYYQSRPVHVPMRTFGRITREATETFIGCKFFKQRASSHRAKSMVSTRVVLRSVRALPYTDLNFERTILNTFGLTAPRNIVTTKSRDCLRHWRGKQRSDSSRPYSSMRKFVASWPEFVEKFGWC